MTTSGDGRIHREGSSDPIIDRQVIAQANVIAFGKIYILSGILLLVALPLLLLLGKPQGSMAGHDAWEYPAPTFSSR
ncbi:MAG TPA: hypothetical protein VKA25_05800 [Gemmatimonadales bacterium]|nr:hypothetical protein [Gemmatimonadales bacterium]